VILKWAAIPCRRGGNAKLPAFSGMAMGSFTNTQKDQTVQSPSQPDAALLSGNNKNNNFTFDEASCFMQGRYLEMLARLVS